MSSNRRPTAWAAVEKYILAREKTLLPLSTRAAVEHLKITVPECEHTDDELVQLVAISAVRHGRALAFDGPFAGASSEGRLTAPEPD
ncbi:hypothetical protein [Tianweitania sediminis]|uniref:Uncharacterized protein n=1 Tax=Tianweitania sediminis TaxID=1502156 RepID=A0A8J7R0Z9_9HYPH|nr:hypothetical protein [Tianweitania sediminis]MBP0438136.1 hypothetical protein [Tianweitania sediminis]